ncbi:MAG: hypothetical protein C4527_23525 [Candidatus Omnitrophota bacterium]|jgi:cytochrome c2|nr:MAG: hypothetical protein C4527_23525 [Candidatus Omnitrophota bacterium]
MRQGLLWLTESGILLFLISGLLIGYGLLSKKSGHSQAGATFLAVLGPLTLAICWKALVLYRQEDCLVWSRLMAGDASALFAFGSLGLIAGSGLAMGALSLRDRRLNLFIAAICVSLSWIVFYLHPTPHYVPMPAWLDKLVWFVLLVGGSIAGLYVFFRLRTITLVAFFEPPLFFAAGLASLLSVCSLAAYFCATSEMDLKTLAAEQRITSSGCLACHTMSGMGRSDPGGGLESVASRKTDTLRAFLQQPNAENARKLGIREAPTGDMAGYHFSEEQVDAFIESLTELFEVKPPSSLGPGSEKVETVFMEKSCLACHTVHGEGAPDGGIGGPLEASANHSRELLVQWLQNPSAENAVSFNLREQPMGAMQSFPLPPDQAEIVADWLLSLEAR